MVAKEVMTDSRFFVAKNCFSSETAVEEVDDDGRWLWWSWMMMKEMDDDGGDG